MFDRSRICEFSIPVGIFVLMLLLFPAAHGSFVATHGPVTALRSLQAATAILIAIAAVHILLTIRANALRVAFESRTAVIPSATASSERDYICSLLC